jgi:hypothetical protein
MDSGSDHEVTDESDIRVLAPDLIRIIENSILTFRLFLKRDKKKSSVINLFGNQNQLATPLQQVQSTLEKVNSDSLPCDPTLEFYIIYSSTFEAHRYLFSF